MRKISNGKNKDLFLIYTKEDTETVVKEFPRSEVTIIAELLGFDLDQDVHFYWFLKQALLELLPKGWKRESSPAGKVLYHNQNSQVTMETHPLVYRFRAAYAKLILKSQGNVFQPIDQEDLEKEPTPYEKLQFTSLLSLQTIPPPRLQSALKDAEEFYSSLISYESPRIPPFIEESAAYQQADPLAVREAAKKLGIQSYFKLYWLARLCVALPLPPCWEVVTDPLGEKRYLTYEYDVVTDESPAVSFMQKLATRILFGGNYEKSATMVFYDKCMLPYLVDIAALSAGEKNFKLKVEDFSLKPEIRTKEVYALSVLPTDVLQGMMLIELANKALVNFDREMHLLSGVAKFIHSIKKQKVLKTWAFRYTTEGERFWFNTSQEKAYNHFPYTKSLFRFIQNKRLRTEKKSGKRIKTYAERHPLFIQHGAGLCERISELSTSAMRLFLEDYLENPKAEKPVIDLRQVCSDMEVELAGVDLMELCFSNPYKVTDQNAVDRDDKDVRLSTDSETEREGGTAVAWENARRLLFDKDNKPSSSLFMNKKLLKPKTEVKRRIQRSNTFKEPSPERAFPISFFDIKRKRSRKSQELHVLQQHQEEFANITESSSENETSSADFESEGESESVESVVESVVKRGNLTPQGITKSKSGSIKQVQFEVLEEMKSNPSGTVTSRRGERTDSGNEQCNTQRGSSSHGGKSGISSRASKRQVESRKTSRPGTGNVLIPGAQPLLVQVRKETPHLRTLLPEIERRSEVLPIPSSVFINESQRSSIEEATLSPIFDPRRQPELIPLSSFSQDLGLSQSSPRELSSTALLAIASPRSQNEGRAGMLPQFALPPLEQSVSNDVVSPRMHSERSEQVSNAAREHFSKYSDAVVSSFFDHVTQASDQPATDPSLREARESEERDSELVGWLSSKEVVAGLGHLLMPILREKAAPVAKSEANLSQLHSQRSLPPIVYHPSEPQQSEVAAPPSRKSMLVTTAPRRESFITTETVAEKAQGGKPKRNSLLSQKTMGVQSEESKVEGLPGSFVLSPKLKSPAPVFVFPPKRVHSLQLTRIYNFLHYLEKVGFPLSTQSEVCHYPVSQEIMPQHIRKMGKRLGMLISAQKYCSAESDLLWIALLQLTAPLPAKYRQMLPGQVVMLPFKSHPGDEFFQLMTLFNRKLRARELDQMVKHEKVKNLLDESWLCLVTRMNSPYLYNFLTGERINLKNQPHRETPDLSNDTRIAEMRKMLEAQIEAMEAQGR